MSARAMALAGLAAAWAAVATGPAPAQTLDATGLEAPEDAEGSVEPQVKAATAPGAVLRALDRVSGAHVDLDMSAGETRTFGRIRVMLGECRYPANNPDGDAYAYLVIEAQGADAPVFTGWMIASSPALSAMDHPRYDVWVLRCKTS